MLSKLVVGFVLLLSGLVVFLGFDWLLSQMAGFTIWSDIHVLLSSEFMSAQHLFKGVLMVSILLACVYGLNMNPVSERIRLGMIYGLITVLTGLVNIAIHIKTVPTEFLANQLAPLSAVLLIKMTLLTWVVAQVHALLNRN